MSEQLLPLFEQAERGHGDDLLPGVGHQPKEVLNLRPAGGDALAICDIKIGGFLIRRVCIRPVPSDVIYVDMPSMRGGLSSDKGPTP